MSGLFDDFYREHPEYIPAQIKEAINPGTGEIRRGEFVNAETIRAMLRWAVEHKRCSLDRARRVYAMFTGQVPDLFPLDDMPS